MAAAPKAQAAVPPPLPPPPAQPVSGIPRQLTQKAPEFTETPKGQNPLAEFNQRQAAAIAKHTGQAQRAEDENAREDAAPPPKAKAETAETTAPTSKPSGKPSAPAPATSAKPTRDTATEKPADADSATPSETTERRYDLQSLRKWAEKHPEEAAEVFTKLGSLPADSRQEWIRLQNRKRKLTETIGQEREKVVSEAKAERQAAEEAKAAIDGAVAKLAPIADLWEAVAEKVLASPDNPQIDFEACDAAFAENAKISIDDYMRLRARRAIGSGPDAVKLRAENARLKRELAGKPSEAIKSKAADAETGKEQAEPPSAAKVKQKDARDWSGEIAGTHKLRQFDGWNVLLDAEMRKHYDPDLDEYSADPDEVADKILRREIEAMQTEIEPPAGKPKPKPNGAAKPNGQAKPKAEVPPASALTPRMTPSDEDDEAKVGGMTWAQRQDRAIKRAMARARGELE